MSGANAPKLELDGRGLRVGIVAAQWHEVVMNGLIEGAIRACERAGASHELIRVPGAFELPLGAQLAARSDKFDAVVALGVVIRGGTPHFEFVCDGATQGLTRVCLDTHIPIGFGLLTVDNEEQALDRAGLAESREDKGNEAVEAALAMALLAQGTFGLAGKVIPTGFR
jgi:6,7-dimethyl-8-ribityllumazine synthase